MSNGSPPKRGRPADERPLVPVRVPPEDYKILQMVESRTALSPEEIARMLLHVAIRESGDLIPEALRAALAEARAALG